MKALNNLLNLESPLGAVMAAAKAVLCKLVLCLLALFSVMLFVAVVEGGIALLPGLLLAFGGVLLANCCCGALLASDSVGAPAPARRVRRQVRQAAPVGLRVVHGGRAA